jgi:hypothetical protein
LATKARREERLGIGQAAKMIEKLQQEVVRGPGAPRIRLWAALIWAFFGLLGLLRILHVIRAPNLLAGWATIGAVAIWPPLALTIGIVRVFGHRLNG